MHVLNNVRTYLFHLLNVREKISFMILLLIFALVLTFFSVDAQISYGSSPASFSQTLPGVDSIFGLPELNVQALLAEDQKNKGGPYRFGKDHEINLNFKNAAQLNILPDGRNVYRLQIQGQSVYSLNFIFSRSFAPPPRPPFTTRHNITLTTR